MTEPSQHQEDNEGGGGFRLDMSRIMFAIVLFLVGLLLFPMLANWTGIPEFRLGFIGVMLGSIYFVVSAFSSLQK